MWFDSHCHLHLFEGSGDLDEVVDRARAAGVAGMLTVGIDIPSSRRSVDIAATYGLKAAVGVHPNSATEWDDAAEAGLRDLLASDVVAAVGESGLDFYRDYAPADAQRSAFTAHIELAKSCGKALVIHTRDSVSDALDLLADVGPPDRFVFHCWSGDEVQLSRALDLGAHISFAGNVSFKNAEDLRSAAAAVPGARLLVETDSPFLSPEPHRGKPNEPSRVSFVGAAVAAARSSSLEALAELTSGNASALFA